jgi:hypothetical protein
MKKKLVFILQTAIWAILWITLAIGVGFFFLHTSQALQARIPLDYGEGPLLNQARWLAEGRPIYRADINDYPFTIANYPPLYPLAVSLAGRYLGFSYETGRMVSAVATLGCGLALMLIVLQTTGDRVASLVAGALFFSFPYVIFWGSLGRVDMLALAFSLWGIWAAIGWPNSLAGTGVSLLFLLAAIFTRQSYLLAAPLAVVVHLATGNWRRALFFALALGISVLAIGGILCWRTEGGFFIHTIVANANTFMPSLVLSAWLVATIVYAPLIVVIFWEFLHYARQPEKRPWFAIAYLIGGTLSGLTVGKVGSNVNYLLEWLASMGLLAGIALARWRRELPRALCSLLLLTFSFQILWSLYWGQFVTLGVWSRRALEPEMPQLEEIVCSVPGPVLADEMMSLLVVCGRDILLQPFEFTRLAVEGKWDQTRVVEDIQSGKFRLILIKKGPLTNGVKGGWTPEMWAAIQEHYEPVTVLADTTVYAVRAGGTR